MEELRHLSMKGVTFKIVITDRDAVGEEGNQRLRHWLRHQQKWNQLWLCQMQSRFLPLWLHRTTTGDSQDAD